MDSPERPHRSSAADILKLPDRSEDETASQLAKEVNAVCKALGLDPKRIEISFTRLPDGKVEIGLAVPPELEEKVAKLYSIKLFGKDTVNLNGIETTFGESEPDIVVKPEPEKPALKVWAAEERKKRSKPKPDMLPDF